MANEIRGVSTGTTCYAALINNAGHWWNGTAFEVYDAGSYSDYDIAMTEQGNSGVFFANFPTTITTGGTYEYYVYAQAGGSPAEGDSVINTGRIDWTGTSSITAASGSMAGSDYRAYVLRKGFKRTDKDTELYEAVTDAIQIMRRRFMFDEAEADTTTTDTISTLGDFRLAIESDLGLVVNIILQDDDTGTPLVKLSKAQFDDMYPSIHIETDRGYPRHYCIFAGNIYIGPIPDQVSYTYRIGYSVRAGTVTSSTAGVPFTNLYRDVLTDLVLSLLWEGLDEFEKANYYKNNFELSFITATRRERINGGMATSCMEPTNF